MLYARVQKRGKYVLISETSLTVFLNITFNCNVSVKTCSFYSQMSVSC